MKITFNHITNLNSKIWFLWPVVIALLMIMTALVTMLAAIGLSETQKDQPNVFHGKYINFSNLWLLLDIFPIFAGIFIILTGLVIMTYPNERPSRHGVEQ